MEGVRVCVRVSGYQYKSLCAGVRVIEFTCACAWVCVCVCFFVCVCVCVFFCVCVFVCVCVYVLESVSV